MHLKRNIFGHNQGKQKEEHCKMDKYYDEVCSTVKTIVSDITKIPEAELGESDNLIELGADSFVIMEANSHFREKFGLDIPVSLYFEDLTTIDAIVEYIINHADLEHQDAVAEEKISDAVVESISLDNAVVEAAQPAQAVLPVYPQAQPVITQPMYTVPQQASGQPVSSDLLMLMNQQMQLMNAQMQLLSGNGVMTPNVMSSNVVAPQAVAPQMQAGSQEQAAPVPQKEVKAVEPAKQTDVTKQPASKDYVAHKKLDLKHKEFQEKQRECLNKIIAEYTEKTKSSKKYVERYRKPYVDVRNIAGFRPDIKEMVYQLIFDNSKGSKVYDIDGNEYVDIAMDFGVNLFGHNPDFVQKALEEEMKKGFPLSLISGLSGEVAELICKITGNDRACFSNSGTEAVMQAIRASRAYTQKNKVVYFSGSYHGSTDVVLGIPRFNSKNHDVVPACTGVPQDAVNDVIMLKYDTEEALEFIAANSDTIAAVLVEPVQSRKPELQPKAFLKKLRELTLQKNIVLIFDEMILGFRVARGGAQQFFDIRADLVTYGKICGGGMPIGVLSGKEEIMGVLDGGLWNYGDDSVPPYENLRTFIGGTFCHHPLTMAAAKAVLTKIYETDDAFYDELNRKTAYLADTLNAYFMENKIPIEVTYCGSLFRFVLKGNLELFYYVMIMKNIYIWEGRNCFLSAAHTMEDIEKIIQTVKETCEMISPFFPRTESSGSESFPLTRQQKQMMLYESKDAKTSKLRENLCLKITNELNLSFLQKAVAMTIDRHEILRAVVSKSGESFVLKKEYKNLVQTVEREEKLQEILLDICTQPFDYENGPLFQVYSIKASDGRYILLTASHLVVDGWSLSVLYQEIVETYNSVKLGQDVTLPKALSVSEFEYELEKKKSKCDKKMVLDTLKKTVHNEALAELPKDVKGTGAEGDRQVIHIRKSIEEMQPVRRLAGQLKCSSFLLMLGAFQILLKEVGNEEKVSVGVPLTAQAYFPEYSVVGNYDMIRPFQLTITDQSTLADVIDADKKLFADYNDILDYQLHDFEELADLEEVPAQVLFNLDRVPRVPSFADTQVSMEDVDLGGIEYDLFFNLVELGTEVKLDISYNSSKFSSQLVMSWGERYFTILKELGKKKNQSMEDYSFLCEKDLEDCRDKKDIYAKNIELLKQYNIIEDKQETEYCYYIMRANHEPQFVGSFGYLFVGTSVYDNDNTGWIAKINLDGSIELLGHSDDLICHKAHQVSLWKIERILSESEDVTYCEAEYTKEALSVYLDFADTRRIPEFISSLRDKLEVWEMPDAFYHDVKHEKCKENRLILQVEFENETEQELYGIVKDFVGDSTFTKTESLLRLGIQSVKMFQLIHEVEKHFGGIRLSIEKLYQNPSVAGIAKMIEQRKLSEDSQIQLTKGDRLSSFPASQVQKRMYILGQIEEDSIAYNLPSVLWLEGDFDKESFESALQVCLDRHDMLRSCFYEENGDIICKVQDKVNVPVEYKEMVLKDSMEDVIERELKDFIRPFKLDKAPMIHVRVLESQQEKKYVVLFDFHHIIFDGLSSLVFAKDFADAYEKRQMKPLEYTYHDYIVMQNQLVKSAQYKEQEKYWENVLADREVREDYLLDNPRRSDRKYTSNVYEVPFSQELAEGIERFCLEQSFTRFSFYIAICNLVFSRYQTSKENTFGTVIHGRTQNELLDMVGMFVNTIPLYQKVDNDSTFVQFAGNVHENCMKAYENAEVPYDRIVEIAGESNDGNRNALFDILLSYQDFEMESDQLLSGMKYEMEEVISPASKFDMELLIADQKDGTSFRIVYAKELYQEATIKRLSDTLVQIIKEVIANPLIVVRELSGIQEEEKEKLITEFNDTAFELDKTKTVFELWEEQVKKMPKKKAVSFYGDSLSYEELDQKANQLGTKLRQMGICPDDFVVIACERSLEMFVGIYGVMKAGGAYVPVDLEYPEERVNYILNDCKPKAVLYYSKETDGSNKEEAVIVKAAHMLSIPVLDIKEESAKDNASPLKSVVTSENLLYCIYTSGTTGKPKGVMIPHRAVVNYCAPADCGIMHEALEEQLSKIVSVTNMVFDIFVTEAWLSLLNGMEVCLLDEEQAKDGAQATQYIVDNQVEILQTTPTRIKIWLSDVARNNPFQNLKYILIGGEKVEKSLIDTLAPYTDANIIDVYGPSETTVWSTRKLLKADDSRISIGSPITNTQVYILDDIRLCGIKMPGELCIGGEGLARGYLNRKELTEEKFIANPYGSGRIYRTGDLARWNEDGTLDFIGRVDEQVKIRGFRIELSEIENVIRQSDGVKEAVVIVQKDAAGEDELCAYIVSDKKELDDIRTEIKKHLPAYMIPAYMMLIPSMPMTKNGKLDKRALPVIEMKSERSYRAPQNETERILSRIFAEALGRQQVGVDEGFFDIGGHSLKATLVVNKIEEETGVRITLKEFFEHGTVEKLAKRIDSQADNSYEPIERTEEKYQYPASPAQKRIFLAHEFDREETAYNMPAVLKFNKTLNRDKIEQCFKTIIDRNEILRTGFFDEKDNVWQRIQKDYTWELEYKEVAGLKEETIEEEVFRFIRPFQLDSAPLLRVGYVESKDESMIMIDMHHIVSDGFSIQVLKEQFAMLYNGIEQWDENQIQYRDYSEWVVKQDLTVQKQYWLEEFQNDIPILEMPLDHLRGNIRSFRGDTIAVIMDKSAKEMIAEYVKKQGITEYMAFLGGLMILLGQYSRQEDLIVGTPVSGRVHRDTENLIGMLGNTLVLRGKPEHDKSVKDFLQEVKQCCIKGMENQQYPFEDLVNEVCRQRDTARNPLFDIMFAFEYAQEEEYTIESAKIEEWKIPIKTAKFDILFTVRMKEEGYEIEAEYCVDLYEKQTIQYMLNHYCEIMLSLCQEQYSKIQELNCIGKDEKHKLLEEFNDSDASYPEDKTVTALFEEQVKKTPQRIAVKYLDDTLTYEQLDKRASQLAARLRKHGVGRNDFVAFIAERSLEMAVGIYGILKAGGAYLPIDLMYPENRISYIISDSNAKALVVYVTDLEKLNQYQQIAEEAKIPLVNLSEEILEEADNTEPNQPGDYIYCIYTSGTTGKPKGVKLMHYNVVRLLFNDRFQFDFDEHDVWTMFHNFNFDFSVWEFFGATLYGGKLIILSYDTVRDSSAVLRVLEEDKVTVLNQVPTSFYQLAEAEREDMKLSLRYVIFGGEALKPEKLDEWQKKHKEVHIINMYGITETTVHVTYKEITRKEIEAACSNIGGPIPTLKVYIMNGDVLCGIGVPGEICVAGAGVASGYMNLPELTDQRFVKNPFGEGRMYRSGDLARWMPDGNLEYLGRIDDQVKIRGFRIELPEIEKVLRQVEAIKDAAALVKTDQIGDRYIQAYYVADEKLETGMIKKAIQSYLPDYMIPSRFLQVDEMPMTVNKKLDKKRLMEMDVEEETEYIAPETEKQELLENIFKEVLGLSKVSIRARFIEMGGDSIKAIRVISKLREAGYELKVMELLQYQTIEEISEILEEGRKAREYQQGELTGEVPLLPIQQAFFERQLAVPEHYNQAVLLKCSHKIADDILTKAFAEIQKHHDMLRAVYQGEKQIVLGTQEAKAIPVYRMVFHSSKELFDALEKENTALQASLSLEEGPLMKAQVYEAGEEQYLFICCHHLVVDGVSWRILVEDLNYVCQMLKEQKEVHLPKKTASYLEWSQELRKQVMDGSFEEEYAYWKNVTDQIQDMPETAYGSKGFTTRQLVCDHSLTEQLMKEAGKTYSVGIHELLVCAVHQAYADVMEEEKVSFTFEGHGREGEAYQMALDRTVGWFTTTYPVVLERKAELEEQLIHVKETLFHIPGKGLGYGLLAGSQQYGLPDVTTRVCFNYLGELDEQKKDGQLFELTSYSVGESSSNENKEEHALIINASVEQGKLVQEITFDSSIWTDEQIEQYLEADQRNLEAIVEHCLAAEETVVTLSDLDIGELDSSDEDVLAAFLDEL